MFTVAADFLLPVGHSQYQEQVKQNGYFSYNGWRLYPSSRCFECERGKFSLDAHTLFKLYAFLELRPNHPSVLERLKRVVWSKPVGINTTLDTDVIFPLLKHYFWLSWSDS